MSLFSCFYKYLAWTLVLSVVCEARSAHIPLEPRSQPVIAAANDQYLHTWWHTEATKNVKTAVADGVVRRSHLYTVQVASGFAKETFYRSFVYAAIPRNGNGNIVVPGDPDSTTTDNDGITVEASLGMSMSWTQFLYSTDAIVKISRPYGLGASAESITIRPTNLGYRVWDSDGDLYISVPYNKQGARFSVEFPDNLYTFHNNCTTPADCYHVNTFTDDDVVMGTEPINSLMIFASPFPQADMVPDLTASSTLLVKPGLVTGLENTKCSTVAFQRGVYWFSGTAHANLSSNVDWVYLAPGAYVKGAVQFNTAATTMKATGHGVLSGEQYVYQANPFSGYSNNFSNADSLRMWRGTSAPNVQQTLYVNGVTISSPPFNTLDFNGDLETISVHAWDYKQVGAFFAQTDGLTLYPGSTVQDVFYHSNDDTIKTYYPDVSVQGVTVWKGTTAPIIQFGWASRSLSNITVNNVNVIHSRWAANTSHPSLIGANQLYGASEFDTATANLSNAITDLTFSNIRSEGVSGNLFRIVPLANITNLTIENVYIEQYPPISTGIRDSQLPLWYDPDGNPVAINGFTVRNLQVGDVPVSYHKLNWEIGQIGSLNIAQHFTSSGSVQVSQ